MHWLLRMKRLAQHPPSWRKVLLGLAVIGVCAALYLIEWLGYWPDWATTNGNTRRMPRMSF